MELFDTHCHLDVREFDHDRDEVLQRARAAGVTRLLVPAVDAPGWHSLRALCEAHEGLYPALGLHPVFLDTHRELDVTALEQQVADAKPAAIGEIGLDYHLEGLDRERQHTLLDAQLVIARDAGLPVVLHCRKAHDPMLAALRRTPVRGGFIHAFNGSLQQAQQYIDMGFRLGFGGTLTYEGSRRIRELARALPLEALVLETDAPDMPVASHRHQRNSPEYLPECLAALVAVRDQAPEEIARCTSQNAAQVLGI